MVDVIGDIHGYADKLRALLAKLGYQQSAGAYRHPSRTAIFVGDLIDGGPQQLETVGIVRAMVDAGSAKAVMGNHELNAVAWATLDPANPGEFLRQRFSEKWGEKNRRQHEKFLAEVGEDSERHREIVAWFKTLPLWIEDGGVRVIHACWHPGFMSYLRPMLYPGNRLPDHLLEAATREPEDELERDTPEPSVFKAVEALLKGVETPLPPGQSFIDARGFKRTRVRVRWWSTENPTFRNVAMLPPEEAAQLSDAKVPSHLVPGYSNAPPLFVGHYWMTGRPVPLAPQFACVDYSAGRGGPATAYRCDGESRLVEDGFVSAG